MTTISKNNPSVTTNAMTLITMTKMAVCEHTRALNPADFVQLQKLYACSDPPFVLRIPQFMELLIDSVHLC